MKTQLIIYGYSWEGWKPGLTLCNVSPTKQAVGITYLRHDNGNVIYGHNIVLEPSLASHTFMVPNHILNAIPPSEYGRLKILVEGNNVIAEALEVNGAQILPINTHKLGDTDYIRCRLGNPSDRYAWPREGAWHTYVGRCFYNYNNTAQVLQHVFKTVAEKFPDRKDHRMSVLDASTASSNKCPNHPVGHTHCSDIDLQYYTLGNNNFTQLAPSGKEITGIWETADKLNELFDVDRNHFFFTQLRKYFPQCLAIVDNKILDALTKDHGSLPWVTGDNVPSYMHGYHTHIRPGQPNVDLFN